MVMSHYCNSWHLGVGVDANFVQLLPSWSIGHILLLTAYAVAATLVVLGKWRIQLSSDAVDGYLVTCYILL